VAETSDLLKERFDYIFYTGSTNVGRIIRWHPVAIKPGANAFFKFFCHHPVSSIPVQDQHEADQVCIFVFSRELHTFPQSGANATIMSYNASNMNKINNTTSSLVRFENVNIFFLFFSRNFFAQLQRLHIHNVIYVQRSSTVDCTRYPPPT
jgi:hypothetical protein